MDVDKLQNRNIVDLFPKIELHRHLEGSFCLDTLFEISQKNKIPNTSKNITQFKLNAQFPHTHKPDFKLFLSKFRNDWYSSHQDVFDVAYNSVKLFKKENLFYIELRFSPEHFSIKNNFDRVEVAKLIIEASKKAATEIGLYINFLITFNRNKQKQEEMLSLYKNLAKAGLTDIVGMDLAGDEILNPPEEFVDFFNVVQSDGAGITIHAGEVTPPQQIWNAVDLLHASRVGHGTTSIKDLDLQKMLIDKNIILEQCPVSNYFTGSCVDTPNHPFKKLYSSGVLVTLNSDDPTIQQTTLSDDFITAIKYFDIDLKKLIKLNHRSLEGSFAPNKAELIRKYKQAITRFENTVK